MKIILVRHGQTEGNREHRFIGGRTDEAVCEEGRAVLMQRSYPKVERVFSSPMARCLQTSMLIFSGKEPEVIPDFRECDFGRLEGKNHKELVGDPEYESFLQGRGVLPFPGGEQVDEFNRRCMRGMIEAVRKSHAGGYHVAGCVMHGGTIMGILSTIRKDSNYYKWNVENGEGYILSLSEEQWENGCYDGTVIGGIGNRIYT